MTGGEKGPLAFSYQNASVTAASGLPYSFGDKPAYEGNDRAFHYFVETSA